MQKNHGGPFVNKLSGELYLTIFEYLGPAQQRILATTCVTLYKVYKSHFWEKQIVISLSDDGFERRNNSWISTGGATAAHLKVIMDWITPLDFPAPEGSTQGLEELEAMYWKRLLDKLQRKVKRKVDVVLSQAVKDGIITAAENKALGGKIYTRYSKLLGLETDGAKRDVAVEIEEVKDKVRSEPTHVALLKL